MVCQGQFFKIKLLDKFWKNSGEEHFTDKDSSPQDLHNNEFSGNGGPPREGGDRGGNFERPNRSEESSRGGDNRL